MTIFQHLNDVLDAYPSWLWLACGGVAALSYFLGCFNGAAVVSRYVLRDDVRDYGSGNAGLTNFHRTFGGGLTVVVILIDALKAVIAILFSSHIFSILSPALVPFAKYWAGLFCLVGHMFPCTFQFRGGKGILSGGVMAILIGIGPGGPLPAWIIPVAVWGGFIVLALLTRYVSLGSCWTGVFFPVTTFLVYREPLLTVLGIIIGGLILLQHRGNIKRLVTGTESKFSLHKKAVPVPEQAAEQSEQPPAERSAEQNVPVEETVEPETQQEPAEDPVKGPAKEVVEEPVEGAAEEAPPAEEDLSEDIPNAVPSARQTAPKAPAQQSPDTPPAQKPSAAKPNGQNRNKKNNRKGKPKSGKGKR